MLAIAAIVLGAFQVAMHQGSAIPKNQIIEGVQR
jgi:hypothetical protein